MPKQGWFTTDKKGNTVNNAAQFATHWYLFGFGVPYTEIAVEYNQADRMSLMNDLIKAGYGGDELNRLVDMGASF
jgi:hypothetical protein